MVSPESLVDGVLTAKSDVWSLGVTLWGAGYVRWFSLTGLLERGGCGESQTRTRQGCASELYVLTLTFLPTVLSMLYSVVCKCGKVVQASIALK